MRAITLAKKYRPDLPWLDAVDAAIVVAPTGYPRVVLDRDDRRQWRLLYRQSHSTFRAFGGSLNDQFAALRSLMGRTADEARAAAAFAEMVRGP